MTGPTISAVPHRSCFDRGPRADGEVTRTRYTVHPSKTAVEMRRHLLELKGLAFTAVGRAKFCCASAVLSAARLSLPRASTASAATAMPLPCVSTAFATKDSAFALRFHCLSGYYVLPLPSVSTAFAAKDTAFALRCRWTLQEEMAEYRLVVLNTWRPITPEPLRREPLAVTHSTHIHTHTTHTQHTHTCITHTHTETFTAHITPNAFPHLGCSFAITHTHKRWRCHAHCCPTKETACMQSGQG